MTGDGAGVDNGAVSLPKNFEAEYRRVLAEKAGAALVEALREHRIAGAGLDVFVYEPIPFDHPLLTCDNVILTPHIGGGTGGARDRQMGDVLANVQRFAAGQPLLHSVA